jgi:hypothetical protein
MPRSETSDGPDRGRDIFEILDGAEILQSDFRLYYGFILL